MNNPTALVQNLWNYCNILRDDGAAKGERRLSVVEELESVAFANYSAQPASASPFCRKHPPGSYSK